MTEPTPDMTGSVQPTGESGRSVWGWRAVWALLAAVLLSGVFVVFKVLEYGEDLPSVEQLTAGYNPPQVTRVYAREGTLLASIFTERRTVIPFEQVTAAAKLAFLAAEDASFYEHEGINYLGILRAAYWNVRKRRATQGGSTITQQVVKNTLLDSSRTVRRKVREAILSLRLERSLTKDEIFALYLNHIYLGHGRYGIQEAARFYFGKNAKALRLDEAATLAGIVASPERYSPRRHPERALHRREYVLNQMLEKGFVTKALHEQVSQIPLRLTPSSETESRLAPEMVEQAKKVLREVVVGDEAGDRKVIGGYSVYTTIDPELQSAARSAIRSTLRDYEKRHKLLPPFTKDSHPLWQPVFEGKPKAFGIYTGTVTASDDSTGTLEVRVGDVVGRVQVAADERYNPGRLKPSEFAQPGAALRVSLLEQVEAEEKPRLRLELGPQAALVALSVRDREVVAMIGSYEAWSGGLNRATQARRQPASAFKPFVYSYAVHSREVTAAMPFRLPKNKRREARSLSLRQAIAGSENAVATNVLKRVGAENVLRWARAFGIRSEMKPTSALALGAYEVTPLELAAAYMPFANGGVAGEPRLVMKVQGPSEEHLPLPARPPETRVLTEAEAFLVTDLLRSVVEDGTAVRARALRREVAGKTGTSNQAKDTWFVGYSTDYLAAVWIGFDDALPLGPRESGARTALPAWIDFMQVAHKGLPKTRFSQPSGLLRIKVDPKTGQLPAFGQTLIDEELFLDGTEPSRVADAVNRDAGATEPAETAQDLAPPF